MEFLILPVTPLGNTDQRKRSTCCCFLKQLLSCDRVNSVML